MSDKNEPIICPNCGYAATGNYCAQCGQETHLHNDTFGALLMHFVGHYFHYDSKFWQTMKALLFSPGKLTTAYWNKQRMRYIAPVSLYIFISAVFFLIMPYLAGSNRVAVNSSGNGSTNISMPGLSIMHDTAKINKANEDKGIWSHVVGRDRPKAGGNLTTGGDDSRSNEMAEHFMHLLPRVLFFMIPVLALILKLFFLRRKDVTFVDHAIFSFHFQSVWFTLMALIFIYRFEFLSNVFHFSVLALIGVYFVLALKNVYKIGWVRAVSYTFIASILFGIALVSGIVVIAELL